jgi:hypothetical protein
VSTRWTLIVRSGPRVQKVVCQDLDDALAQLEERARELADGVPQQAVGTKLKRFEPGQQVLARLEVAGPQRLLPSVRVGLDVRGDGTVQAYAGRVRRQLIEPQRGESPYAALRRATV